MPENIRVYGYHGTSAEAAEVIIQQGFNVSSNDYDWLGTGVYFFQDAPVRAWEWATQQHPTNPAVIRSTIRLEDCIDLLDIEWFPIIREAYTVFVEEFRQANRPLPRQNPERSKAHRLDCAYFNYLVEQILNPQVESIRVIRGIFVEGERIFPNSAVFDRAHIQISVRDISLIEESYLIDSEGELL
ncbi:hypothetical protein ACE1CI_17040 [Aerosakkonemataceae cyanobacterium BLCC-F50]|uniref:DUF3990 domain-containing protein n=1 Tax=Floridaenema flaviceps BLCC-F50 TaxID=3153642 RepID=A0ABV4XU54_9CYAN